MVQDETQEAQANMVLTLGASTSHAAGVQLLFVALNATWHEADWDLVVMCPVYLAVGSSESAICAFDGTPLQCVHSVPLPALVQGSPYQCHPTTLLPGSVAGFPPP